MTGRRLASGAAGLVLGLLATVAAPQFAEAETRLVSVGAVFPFLDKYYGLPPAQRSRFALSYTIRAKDRSPVVLTLVEDGTETPIALSSDGVVEHPPTSQQLTTKARIRVVSTSAKLESALLPEAVVRIANEIPTADLAASDAQLSAAIKSRVGLLGFVVPKFTRAVFPKAEGAVLVGVDGRETPLPIVRNAPNLDFAALSGARAVRFAKPPARVLLLPAAGK